MKIKPLLVAMTLSMGLASGQTETKTGIGVEINKAITAHQGKMEDFMKKVRALPREDQGEFYRANYPKPDETVASLSALVEANPTDPAILEAVTWIARSTRGAGLEAKDFANLKKHHLNNDNIGDVTMALVYSQEAEARDFLSTVSEKSTSKKARGTALYALAIGMERDKTKAAEYDAITNKIINDHPDLEIRDRNIATALKAKKEAAVKFAIGKVAPEIIGKDVDGNEMKLSDYKGKVVVLDFWGDW